MRLSKTLLPTLKENPQDAELLSHKLMVRAGLIRKLASGTYSYLPFGKKCLENVSHIIREEMDRVGALEVLLPAIHPEDLWVESGRLEVLGDDMVKFEDRHGKKNVLGPTHEEVITDLARKEINSYKQLPMTLYQIQTKFRDEMRPRAGVVRSREFIMKDAYSFHASLDCLDRVYDQLRDAYKAIFSRCGLEFYIVKADPGAMGGGGSEEFVLFSDAGEDYVARFGETSNVFASDVAVRKTEEFNLSSSAPGKKERIETPHASSIESVAKFLNVDAAELVKTILFVREDKGTPVAVMVRGDHEVSEYKVRKAVPGARLATPQEISEMKITAFGFSGPLGLLELEHFTALMDADVAAMTEMIVGGNQKDVHIRNVSPNDVYAAAGDGKRLTIGDFRHILESDTGIYEGVEYPVSMHSAIELGHIFKLLTRYSASMKATFLDENGKDRELIMGCYGIGVNRLIASAIEQRSSEKGIVWPSVELSPYQACIITTNMKNDEVIQRGEELYEACRQAGIDVLWDDRNQSAGIKFNDADLIGIPYRLTVGPRGVQEGLCEFKDLMTGEEDKIPFNEVAAFISERLKSAIKNNVSPLSAVS